jgi:hypothetical protein
VVVVSQIPKAGPMAPFRDSDMSGVIGFAPEMWKAADHEMITDHIDSLRRELDDSQGADS